MKWVKLALWTMLGLLATFQWLLHGTITALVTIAIPFAVGYLLGRPLTPENPEVKS